MAFSNTYDVANTGSAVSNREDLTDVLTILAPEETPVLSSAQKQRAMATNTEWTVDSLSTPSTAGIIEGEDVVTHTDQFAGRARMGNFTQKFRRDYKVSDLQEAVESVGPARIAQAEAKAIRELKRDIEATLCSANIKQPAGTTTPYEMTGLGGFIDSAAADTTVPAGFKTPASSIYTTAEAAAAGGAFSETAFNDIISSIFEVNGVSNGLVLVADVGLRRVISDFARLSTVSTETSIRNVNYDGGVAAIKLSVELYQSDHGVVSIVNANPDCMPNFGGTTANSSGYLVNPEYYGVHELIPMGSTRQLNNGGGERGFVDCALTLGVYHPQAHGLIQDVK